MPYSPQVRPLYVLAGSAAGGRQFAAQYAKAMFTAHPKLASIQGIYCDMKQHASLIRRHPEHVNTLSGLGSLINSIEAEALDALLPRPLSPSNPRSAS